MIDSKIVNIDVSMANVSGMKKLDCFYHLKDDVFLGNEFISF